MLNAFSDGNPLYEALVFLLVLTAFVALMASGLMRDRMWNAIEKIAQFSRTRRALPEHELLLDLRKIDLARILTGILATWRYAEVSWSQTVLNAPGAALISGAAAGLAIMVTLGF
ncbi:hypothetical protein, partial [Microvirga lenta]|uniref:hypothetical protein n=1 Tax=Microvirga lenta TaxID=2881337 RepID=UPI001CFFC10D